MSRAWGASMYYLGGFKRLWRVLLRAIQVCMYIYIYMNIHIYIYIYIFLSISLSLYLSGFRVSRLLGVSGCSRARV